MIRIDEAKSVIRLVVNEQRVIFITIWSTAIDGAICVEIANGIKTTFARKGEDFNMQGAFAAIGIEINILEAAHIANTIRKHLEIF